MTAILLSGAEPARVLRERLRPLIAELRPRLVIVQVGALAESEKYVGAKLAAAEDLGLSAERRRLAEHASVDDLLAMIEELNTDASVTGYLLQLPLPPALASAQAKLFAAMDPAKDVDGLTAANMGALAIGKVEELLPPATAAGVVRLLRHYALEIAGKHVVILGRSMLVGKPLGLMLLNRDATVTFCHSRTPNLAEYTLSADIVVCATGQPGLLRANMLKPGATVVDIGIRSTPDGLKGDADDDVAAVAGALTPVPGGVGPMTVACLLANCVTAAARQQGGLPPSLE